MLTELSPYESKDLEALAGRTREYITSAKAENTLRAYRSDWRQFTQWCRDRGLSELPAEPGTVALYVSDLAGVKAAATISRHLSSIAVAHRSAGLDSPTTSALVRETVTGVRRTFGTAQSGKRPVRVEDLRRMVDGLDLTKLIDVRDRALLLIGFAAALRRSEIAALQVHDIEEATGGLVLTLRRSKSDQDGAGEPVGVPRGTSTPTCPAGALALWLTASGITSGPIFRPVDRHGSVSGGVMSGRAVSEVVKRRAAAVGLDPTAVGGHSLRAGLITSAAEAGVAERDIMRQSRHRSVPVMRRYIRRASLFEANAAGAVGL